MYVSDKNSPKAISTNLKNPSGIAYAKCGNLNAIRIFETLNNKEDFTERDLTSAFDACFESKSSEIVDAFFKQIEKTNPMLLTLNNKPANNFYLTVLKIHAFNQNSIRIREIFGKMREGNLTPNKHYDSALLKIAVDSGIIVV